MTKLDLYDAKLAHFNPITPLFIQNFRKFCPKSPISAINYAIFVKIWHFWGQNGQKLKF